MPGVIIDLDRSKAREPSRPVDRLAIPVLALGCIAFALAVSVGGAGASSSSLRTVDGQDRLAAGALVPRGVALTPLQLSPQYANVDLFAMADRLANEAAPWTLRGVITVRGVPGVASIEGPAVILWTEGGIAYRLASPTRTTGELIQIANELR